MEFGVVVTIDATDVVELSLNVMVDAVDSSFVFSAEEITSCPEASAIDVTTVEDEIDDVSSTNSVVV